LCRWIAAPAGKTRGYIVTQRHHRHQEHIEAGVIVAGLLRKGALIEISAIAVLPA
jgi:hypothetical protein